MDTKKKFYEDQLKTQRSTAAGKLRDVYAPKPPPAVPAPEAPAAPPADPLEEPGVLEQLMAYLKSAVTSPTPQPVNRPVTPGENAQMNRDLQDGTISPATDADPTGRMLTKNKMIKRMGQEAWDEESDGE